MNRRSFMKKVGGALAGVVALGLPSKKPKYISGTTKLTEDMLIKAFNDMPQGRTKLEFNSGDISQTLQSRMDMKKYNEGCRMMSNLRCFMDGAV